jgi:hypothetical protein
MRSFLSFVAPLALLATWAGCFPWGSSSGSDGGSGGYGYSSPTLLLTVNGMHFGPAAPTGSASLINSRDAAGNRTGGSFRLDVSINVAGGAAGCQLAFDRFGPDTAIGVGQYTVSSSVGATTPSGYVYPTGAEAVTTPDGNGSCTGSGCDFGALMLSDVTADHVQGYWSGNVQNAVGPEQVPAVCSFYVKWSQYQP